MQEITQENIQSMLDSMSNDFTSDEIRNYSEKEKSLDDALRVVYNVQRYISEVLKEKAECTSVREVQHAKLYRFSLRFNYITPVSTNIDIEINTNSDIVTFTATIDGAGSSGKIILGLDKKIHYNEMKAVVNKVLYKIIDVSHRVFKLRIIETLANNATLLVYSTSVHQYTAYAQKFDWENIELKIALRDYFNGEYNEYIDEYGLFSRKIITANNRTKANKTCITFLKNKKLYIILNEPNTNFYSLSDEQLDALVENGDGIEFEMKDYCYSGSAHTLASGIVKLLKRHDSKDENNIAEDKFIDKCTDVAEKLKEKIRVNLGEEVASSVKYNAEKDSLDFNKKDYHTRFIFKFTIDNKVYVYTASMTRTSFGKIDITYYREIFKMDFDDESTIDWDNPNDEYNVYIHHGMKEHDKEVTLANKSTIMYREFMYILGVNLYNDREKECSDDKVWFF